MIDHVISFLTQFVMGDDRTKLRMSLQVLFSAIYRERNLIEVVFWHSLVSMLDIEAYDGCYFVES